MAQEQGGSLPTGQGGLVSYFESESGVKIDPKTVFVVISVFAVFEVAIQTQQIRSIFV